MSLESYHLLYFLNDRSLLILGRNQGGNNVPYQGAGAPAIAGSSYSGVPPLPPAMMYPHYGSVAFALSFLCPCVLSCENFIMKKNSSNNTTTAEQNCAPTSNIN